MKRLRLNQKEKEQFAKLIRSNPALKSRDLAQIFGITDMQARGLKGWFPGKIHDQDIHEMLNRYPTLPYNHLAKIMGVPAERIHKVDRETGYAEIKLPVIVILFQDGAEAKTHICQGEEAREMLSRIRS